MTPRKHELEGIALATARCRCGWKFYMENLKGKTDEELAATTYAEWEAHKKAME